MPTDGNEIRRHHLMSVSIVQQLGGREWRASSNELGVEVTALGDTPDAAHFELSKKVRGLIRGPGGPIRSLQVDTAQGLNLGGLNPPTHYVVLIVKAEDNPIFVDAVRALANKAA